LTKVNLHISKNSTGYDRAEELGARIRDMIRRYPDYELLRDNLKEYDELQEMLDVAVRMAREERPVPSFGRRS
jgi:hypothetical protein